MSSEAVDGEQSRDQAKSGRGHQWRDKLKGKAAKLTKGNRPPQEELDKDVSDFLRSSSTSKPRSEQNSPPRIDTTAAALSRSPEDSPGTRNQAATKYPIRKRRPKPPGTHVSFSENEPDIIGEGGDEAELPAKDVVTSWKSHAAGDEFGFEAQIDKSFGDLLQLGSDDRSRRNSVQRAPTRHRPTGDWQFKRQSMAAEEALAQQTRKEEHENKTGLFLEGGQQQGQSEVEESSELQNKTDGQSRNEQPEPPIAHSSLDGTINDRETGSGSNIKPFTEKSYLLGKSKDDKGPSEVPSKESKPDSQGFLAYNPSFKKSADTANQVSPRRPSAQVESHPSTRARENPLDLGNISSQNSSRETIQSQGASSIYSVQNSVQHYTPSSNTLTRESSQTQSVLSTSSIAAESEAVEDFCNRMQHMRGIFRLAAEKSRLNDKTDAEWLRASAWWFLRGKTMLEASIWASNHDQERPGSRGRETNLPSNKQCYVDIAKAFWIYNEKIPYLEDVKKSNSRSLDRIDGLDFTQLATASKQVKRDMQAFIEMLVKRDLLPPPALLVQGADPEIWVQYPALPQGIFALTAGLDPRTLMKYVPPKTEPFFSIPLSDTEQFFSYGRFFGEALVLSENLLTESNRFACIATILRQRNGSSVEILVASQDGQINVRIQSDKTCGPTWEMVEWQVKAQTLAVRLSQDLVLAVRLRESDFKTLWGFHAYYKRIEVDKSPKPNEELLFSDMVSAFHHIPAKGTQSGFPTTAVKNCRVRLFQQNNVYNDGATHRHIYCGYRLVAVTPSHMKILSSLSVDLGNNVPIFYSNLKGEKDAPALLIRDVENKASVVITFDNLPARTQLHTILAATAISPDESFSEEIPFSSMTLKRSGTQGEQPTAELSLPQSIEWQMLKVINHGSSLEESQCVLSDRLRVCLYCNYGTITDRINLGTGELCIGLDIQDTTAINLYRPAQNNLTLSFAENLVPKNEVSPIRTTIREAASGPSCRTYKFMSLSALHHFQAVVTGHSVIFDGQATSFLLNRRRTGIPIHKRLEASLARVQVIQKDEVTQLLTFLKDFPLGKCMNFVLREMDVLEPYAKGGKYGIKFVEAKFAMPKTEKSERWDMVCLDCVEYPTEHDDIVIAFDSEDECNNFATALPAGLTKSSRIGSFRK